jgi:hypothetical protein
MKLSVGDVVRIDCTDSKYDGIIGEIFRIQESSEYAIVDIPKGTEKRLERIAENAIIEELKRRKTPPDRWPNGDPQWFPLTWLTIIQPSTPSELQLVEVSK